MNAAILLCALAAPAPPPKKALPPPAIPAPCATIMTWKGTDAVTHFHPDGVYTCCWCGRWWDGTWSQSGGILRVEEWPRDSVDAGIGRWEVRLSAPDAGLLGETAWKIRPLIGRVD
jgi:hypothetical protein